MSKQICQSELQNYRFRVPCQSWNFPLSFHEIPTELCNFGGQWGWQLWRSIQSIRVLECIWCTSREFVYVCLNVLKRLWVFQLFNILPGFWSILYTDVERISKVFELGMKCDKISEPLTLKVSKYQNGSPFPGDFGACYEGWNAMASFLSWVEWCGDIYDSDDMTEVLRCLYLCSCWAPCWLLFLPFLLPEGQILRALLSKWRIGEMYVHSVFCLPLFALCFNHLATT